MRKIIVTNSFLLLLSPVFGQMNAEIPLFSDRGHRYADAPTVNNRFIATGAVLDAAINSLNSLSSLLKKENYRNKVIAFNNPASGDMGFNLEAEIQSALKPILEKTRKSNAGKVSAVVSALINSQSKQNFPASVLSSGNLLSSVVGLVSSLVVQEKKVTREDLDSFLITVNRYFAQYEKLNKANLAFDQGIDKLSTRLFELQYDIREFILDMILILHKNTLRSQLKAKPLEELLLRYIDPSILDTLPLGRTSLVYPSDGIKTAKEIVNGIQKLFTEYQKIYGENYNQIRNILNEGKDLGKQVNSRQIDSSLEDLQELYIASKDADIVNLRLQTLAERLKILVNAEQAN
jgi:hypothetical protein